MASEKPKLKGDLDKEILHIFKLAYLDRFFTISTQEEIIEKYS